MRFTEEQAVEVKEWVVKKLEHISDADSDVLADYVLALIRTDAPDEEIRKASLDNLEDFLKDNTAKFVDEIFETFNPKPQPPPQQQQQQQLPPASIQPPAPHFPNPAANAFHNQMRPSIEPYGQIPGGGPGGPGFGSDNNSRKRSFHEHAGDEQDSHYNRGDRSFKNPRVRRGGSMGRGDRMGRGDGRPQGPTFPPTAHTAPQQGGFSGMPPAPPPGFPPFDPNDPMAAMLAIQNMFPQIPGMPPLPQVPTGSGSPGQPQQTPAGSPPITRIAQRCKDYDTQGFCVLGSTCPYQHGNDHVVAPEDDEYDPTNAKIIDTKRSTNGANGQRSPQPFRGHERGRGRGRGRGDRGGFGTRGRNRADFSLAGPNDDKSITTIVVEQIPEDKFNEQSIREFFSEFGEIVEVTLQAYKHLALVKYDSYAAARRAWASPKVIFDNRFVKVYWYKPNPKAETGGSRPSAPAESRPEEPAFDKEEFEKQQADAQKTYEEKVQKRKEAEEARQALEKQREGLLKKQQEEKAKLMQRLGDKGVTTNGSGGDVGREGSQENNGNGTPVEGDSASEQTRSLRAQLAALEAEAKSMGIDPENGEEGSFASRGRGRGRGGYRGRGAYAPRGRGGFDPSFRGSFRGRGAPRGGRGGVLRLDNRPKRVAVSGVQFDAARDEALRTFLVGVGGFESIEQNPDRADSQIVSFKDRYLAEQLMYGTSDIPSVGKVELSWVAGPSPNSVGSSTPVSSHAQQTHHEEDTMMGDGGEADPLAMRKDAGNDVDYDVAEVDDGWGIE